MSKIPMTTQTRVVEVVSAIAEEDGSGINLRVKNENGELEGFFCPAEIWGRIPPNKNAAVELDKIARILNGFKETSKGEWVPIENFKPKKIKIEMQG